MKRKYFLGILEIVVFLMCLAGFFHQTVQFYKHYSTFPTVISTEIKTVKKILMPAMTVCNSNPVRRSRYCDWSPHSCIQPPNVWAFCHYDPRYCKFLRRNDTLWILSPNKTTHRLVTPDHMLDLMDNLTIIEHLSKDDVCRNTDRVNRDLYEARAIFTRAIHEPFSSSPLQSRYNNVAHFTPCWTFYRRTQRHHKISTMDACEYRVSEELQQRLLITALRVRVNESEVLDPRAEAGALFTLHSPYNDRTLYVEGKFLEPGKEYLIFFNMEEEHRLPYPYQTDCMDYPALWLNNNRTGPRSQQMCQDMCRFRFGELKGHLPRDVTSFDKQEVLEEKIFEGFIRDDEALTKCMKNCKPDCVELRFIYSVEERKVKTERFTGYIWIYVYFKSPRVVVIKHKPQYTDVEIFSYIGGFMGCWLGVSVWALYRILQNTFFTPIKNVRPEDNPWLHVLALSFEATSRGRISSPILKRQDALDKEPTPEIFDSETPTADSSKVDNCVRLAAALRKQSTQNKVPTELLTKRREKFCRRNVIVNV